MITKAKTKSAVAQQLTLNGFALPKTAMKRIRNYLAGQVIGLTRDESLLEEVLKCTYCRVMLERERRVKEGEPAGDSEVIAKLYRQAFTEIREKFPILFPGETEILLENNHITYVDHELSHLSLVKTNYDVVGDIYEAFMGASYKGQAGQFFTPTVAIDTLVALTQPKETDMIIDPACGSGGFLLGATRYIAQSGDLNPSHIHGVDKDEYLVRLSQLHLAIKFNTTFPIHCADSLVWQGNGLEGSRTKFLLGKYDLVLANPPFGSKIVALTGNDRRDFCLAYNWRYSKKSQCYEKTNILAKNTPPQVLFIERCISLLTEGGRAGLVVPESLLSSKGYRYVVQYMLQNTTPIAVIGMPESLFKISGKGGTHTKVCLIVLQKTPTPENHQIFMAEAKWCGHDSRAKEIPKNDLPEIIADFEKFKQGEELETSQLGYSVAYSELKDFVLAPRFYDPKPTLLMAQLKHSHDFVKFGDLMKSGAISLATGDEIGRLAYGTGDIPFVRTSDISNWEVKISPKHTVSHEFYEQYCEKQDVREGDILMVRDGTYLIGTCAMVSAYDTQIIYQSHLYKIRVHDQAPVTNYLLLAMLSSPFVVSQIKSLSFTQDIIDSLGDRIKDIILPIPKEEGRKREVSDMVKMAIRSRIEARELARQARHAILLA